MRPAFLVESLGLSSSLLFLNKLDYWTKNLIVISFSWISLFTVIFFSQNLICWPKNIYSKTATFFVLVKTGLNEKKKRDHFPWNISFVTLAKMTSYSSSFDVAILEQGYIQKFQPNGKFYNNSSVYHASSGCGRS